MKYKIEISCVDGETVQAKYCKTAFEALEYLQINDHEGSGITLSLIDPGEIYSFLITENEKNVK